MREKVTTGKAVLGLPATLVSSMQQNVKRDVSCTIEYGN